MDSSRRCTATNRAGKRCGNPAIVGATVCRSHGGAAPQVRRAAQHRAARLEAHARAERMLARAGLDADPIEHLIDCLLRAAALRDVWGEMVAALDAAAETAAASRQHIRGELGYTEADEDSFDELHVVARDQLLALDRHGAAHIHPFVDEYNRALDRHARFAKLCVDAGVAERQIRIAEQQGQLVAQVIRGVLIDLGVADHPEAPAVVRRHLTLIAGDQAA